MVKAAPQEPDHGPVREKTTLFAPLRFEWNPKWAKFRTAEYVITALQGVVAIGATAIPGAERFKATNGFDTGARNVFRANTLHGRQVARDISDAGLVLLVNHRLVDDAFVAWWWHDKGSVAWQLGAIDAETLTFSMAVQGIVAGVAGRQRPYGEPTCNNPLESQTANCTGSNRYRSFMSGHATASFTLAGLTCMHHAYLPLYGGGAPDALACAGSMAAATTVAMMRVVSDQHYLSDVIIGSAFGALAGVGMPWLLHYRGGGTPDQTAPPDSKHYKISATLMPTPNGVFVMGTF